MPKADMPSFEAPQVANIYEQDTSAFFPTGSRPVVTNVPPPAMPQQPMAPSFQQGQSYSFGQQPMQPQQGAPSPYQPPIQQPQQPQMAEKDDLGVPAYLRRGTKK